MKKFKPEILRRLSDDEKSNLSKLGEKIIDEIDSPHILTNNEQGKIASHIFVMIKWINEFDGVGVAWEITVSDGLPYITMV
jgi:hypothetical protein